MIQKPQKPLHLYKAMELKTPKVRGEYIFTEKKDGIFVCIDYDPLQRLWLKPKSFAQRIIPAFDHVDLNRKSLAIGRECRLIMEATIPGLDFHTANGIFNRRYELATDTVFWLHDVYLPGTLMKATERLKLVEELHPLCGFEKMPLLGCSSNPDDWQRWFEQVVDAGGEGVVGKQAHSLYAPTAKNETMIKIKEEVTKGLLCVRIERTIGKKGEPSLSLILRNKAGKEITVVVPKDSDQIRYENTPIEAIGHVFEVKAMKELPGGALREPRLKVRRDDKTAEEID
jgi:hypothetical protein